MFSTQPSGFDALIHRPRPSKWQNFVSNPITFIAQFVYGFRCRRSLRNTALTPSRTSPTALPVTVVCISDTHNSQPHVPNGDILIHAGDLTQSGSHKELQEALSWLNSLPHKHKVVVAGNHDYYLDSSGTEPKLTWGDIVYLQNSSATLTCGESNRIITIYGSPYSIRHGNWAFQYPRSRDIWRETIPSNTDILVTHTPPGAHLDLGYGCEFLLQELWRLNRRPYLHVFGHVHEGYGVEIATFDGLQRAYEKVLIRRTNRLVGLVRMVVHLVWMWMWIWIGRGQGRRVEDERETIFVNASIVGGLRDEKRRKPAIVTI